MDIMDVVGVKVNRAEGQLYEAADKGFQDKYPGIFEFLSRIHTTGGDRNPGTLILKYNAGRASLCLSDDTTHCVAFHSDNSIYEALTALEDRLCAGKLDWREKKEPRGQR